MLKKVSTTDLEHWAYDFECAVKMLEAVHDATISGSSAPKHWNDAWFGLFRYFCHLEERLTSLYDDGVTFTVETTTASNAIRLPLTELPDNADCKWMEACLKERLDHPDVYARHEDVDATVENIRQWLTAHDPDFQMNGGLKTI